MKRESKDDLQKFKEHFFDKLCYESERQISEHVRSPPFHYCATVRYLSIKSRSDTVQRSVNESLRFVNVII